MRTLRLVLAVSLVATTAGAQSVERLFYYTDNERSWDSFVKHVDQITIVGPQTYSVDSLGVLWGDVDQRLIDLAKQHNVKVMPLFVNEGFNQPELRKLIGD